MSADSRRLFLKKSTLLGAGIGLPGLLTAQNDPLAKKLSNEAVILFQGDSITDGNRTRDKDWNHIMGHGYAYLISSRLWFDHPDKNFHFFNRGISGNTITDLTKRWQTDTLDIKPNLLSILIGVNDTSMGIKKNDSFTPESFETGYRSLLKKTKEEQPNVKLVICEPFILPVGYVKDNWEAWHQEITQRQIIVKKVAAEFNALFVDFQNQFNRALKKAPANYWIWDGVHPMPAGHELMARYWLKVVNKQMT